MNIEIGHRPVGYARAHGWVRSARGPANRHPCVACGKRAYDWAYRYGSTTCITGDRRYPNSPYSYNPDDYDPRCRTCHKRYDLANGVDPDAPRPGVRDPNSPYSERHERRLRTGR